VDGYKANSTFSATKTGTPVVETQQSISVITRDRIEDQGALTLQDALGYTAGVSALALMALTIAATGLLSAVLRLCSTKMV
jgi:outer membrane receptor for ferric coprogen and ferric-rhodotorulic acid